MRDYAPFFNDEGWPNIEALRAANVPYPGRLSKRSQKWRDALNKDIVYTYVFDEGIVFCFCKYDKLTQPKPSIKIAAVPWAEITGLDVRSGRVLVFGGPHEPIIDGGIFIMEGDPEEGKSHLIAMQLQGMIPNRVVVQGPEGKAKEKGSRGEVLGGLLVWAIIILVGVPFFKGGGSLAAAVTPGMAEITPDAVELAIKNNPEWPALTQVTLEGMAMAIKAAPGNVLTAITGTQPNTFQSLWLIPVYWAEVVANRDWQVSFLSDVIAKSVNKKPSSD